MEVIEEINITVDKDDETLAEFLTPSNDLPMMRYLRRLMAGMGAYFSSMVREEPGRHTSTWHYSLGFGEGKRSRWPQRHRVSPLPSCQEEEQRTRGSRSH